MELFYAYQSDGVCCRLDADESQHCVRVLRHRRGDEVFVIDGEGVLYRCRLTDDDPKAAQAGVEETFPGWGLLPYRLTIGCCPTKNNDRFEWFVEKAVEMGLDAVVPLIGARSERRVYKSDRARRIALSATKQSLKSKIPEVADPRSVADFLRAPREGVKLIACCFDEPATPRVSLRAALQGVTADVPLTVLIGPEGDFSPEEVQLALAEGYRPVHIGTSRLRTETAALAAVAAVYFHFMD